MSLKSSDSANIWHPYTQMKLNPETIPLVKGEGSWLIDEDGNRILDAISSWWVNTHGHCHPHIAKRVSEQLSTLEHSIFAGFTHPRAVEIAEKLVGQLKQQDRVFFSDNGSTAVEVALKMSMQYWHNQGIERPKIVALEGAYHGDTFGAMSVSGRSAFTNAFERYFFEVEHLPFPSPGNEEAAKTAMQQALSGGEVAAFIFEPLVQGASGMRMYAPEVLQTLVSMARQAGALIIADEVFSGFGRTGKWFATDHIEAAPDIYCLSKGLTGGAMALGITTCQKFVYEAFLSDDRMKTFFHGHSFTANPVACAAACASFELFEEAQTWTNIHRIIAQHEAKVATFESHPAVREVRLQGTILAVDFEAGGGTGYFNAIRDEAYQYFLERGVLLRPLGNTIYTVPPYCISEAELENVYTLMLEFANRLVSAEAG